MRTTSSPDSATIVSDSDLGMYNVPGHGEIGSGEFDRYTRSKRQDEAIMALIAKRIHEGLQDNDITVQINAARMIEYAPESEKEQLRVLVTKRIREELQDKDLAVQVAVVEMIQYAPVSEKASLMYEAIRRGLGNEVIKSPLYKKYTEATNTGDLRRAQLEKSGSGTTLLLGDPFKDRIIIRHISPISFLAWQKLYENVRLWRDNGFDYIPIEPIQRYRLRESTGLVDVYTGVLDLSFAEWRLISGGMFDKELMEKVDLIKKNLLNKVLNMGTYIIGTLFYDFLEMSKGIQILLEFHVYM